MSWEDPRDEPRTAIPSGFDDDQVPSRRPSGGRALLALLAAIVIPLIALWLLLQLAGAMPR